MIRRIRKYAEFFLEFSANLWDAGHSIPDAANMKVYRKYTELFRDFIFQKEGCTRFQGSYRPLALHKVNFGAN